jgi:hypothetical protein
MSRKFSGRGAFAGKRGAGSATVSPSSHSRSKCVQSAFDDLFACVYAYQFIYLIGLRPVRRPPFSALFAARMCTRFFGHPLGPFLVTEMLVGDPHARVVVQRGRC